MSRHFIHPVDGAIQMAGFGHGGQAALQGAHTWTDINADGYVAATNY